MAANLAPVYLDDNRIRLQGDPRPKVSRILEAGGRRPLGVQVMKLKSQQDERGQILRPDDVVDRTEHVDVAVYLKVVQNDEAGAPRRSDDAETGQADVPQGAAAKQEGKEFGRQGSDMEEHERGKDKGKGHDETEVGLGERTGGQPITGMGQKQQSGRERMAQDEWKAGEPGIKSHAGARPTGASGGLGGPDDSTGQHKRQFSGGKADIRSQQTGREGGAVETLEHPQDDGKDAEDRASSEGAGRNRGERPKRRSPDSETDPAIP